MNPNRSELAMKRNSKNMEEEEEEEEERRGTDWIKKNKKQNKKTRQRWLVWRKSAWRG